MIRVIRNLLVYAAVMVTFIVAGSLLTGTPLEVVAWTVLLVEVVPLATWGGAMAVRAAIRASSVWYVEPPPKLERVPRVTAEVVAPPQCYVIVAPAQPAQIEAPGRELIVP